MDQICREMYGRAALGQPAAAVLCTLIASIALVAIVLYLGRRR